MTHKPYATGVVANRLDRQSYQDNFSDLHPALDDHEARVEADRCYFCYDAPCMTACPTSIDIPMFIRQISTGNPLGSAKTIFDQNILGGMCARVCPTETLCEEVCVREIAEGKPVKIGQLQRYSTDIAVEQGKQFYDRAVSTGKRIAVIGAGPAGLACAHRLSMHGHDITIFEARQKSGGLNEFGIAAYKSTDGFAQREIDYITAIGGITLETGKALGTNVHLTDLVQEYDAVFIGVGLGAINALRADGEDTRGVGDAIDYISDIRQADDLSKLPIGRRIVVIGGGMTAIDVAIQAKLLGAEDVTICYRRGKDRMNASAYEQDLATSKGVLIRHWLQPKRILSEAGTVSGIELEYTTDQGTRLAGTGEMITLQADQVFKAIGQALEADPLTADDAALELENGRIKVDADFKTSASKIWAGGDCIGDGEDLTVSAAAHGRDAAENIHKTLSV